MDKKNLHKFEELEQIIRTLRGPEGCPWDRKQTIESIAPLTIEETAELLDAIENKDSENTCEELGDILLHIILYSVIAEETNDFKLADVIKGISEKMIRRHPHIFGDADKMDDPDKVLEVWNKIKAKEKGDKKKKFFAGIPNNLPALMRADKVQIRAAKVGFDWDNQEQIIEKLEEEIAELKDAIKNGSDSDIEEELGDVLFSAVNICRFRKQSSSEKILNRTTDKFIKRFSFIEAKVEEEGKDFSDYSIDELENFWQMSKKNI